MGLGGACLGSSTQACQTMDADGDRDVDSADYAIISDYVSTLTADTQLQRVPAAPSTRRGNPFAHQGLLYDAEIASYQNRARQYDPKMRRFVQRDPLQVDSIMVGSGVTSNLLLIYRDGLNLSLALQASPLANKDPDGLAC